MAFVIEPRTYDDPDVARMVAEVQQVYVEMYGGPDEAAVDPDEFDAAAGAVPGRAARRRGRGHGRLAAADGTTAGRR